MTAHGTALFLADADVGADERESVVTAVVARGRRVKEPVVEAKRKARMLPDWVPVKMVSPWASMARHVAALLPTLTAPVCLPVLMLNAKRRPLSCVTSYGEKTANEQSERERRDKEQIKIKSKERDSFFERERERE